jgi:hypothetical protein
MNASLALKPIPGIPEPAQQQLYSLTLYQLQTKKLVFI